MRPSDAPVKTPPPANDHPDRFRARDEAPIVVDGVDARQGVTGHNVRYVLGFGLTAVIVAFAVIFFFYFFPFQ